MSQKRVDDAEIESVIEIELDDDEPRCEVCGCSEEYGCTPDEGGPCWWVDTAGDRFICSACVDDQRRRGP